MTAATLVGVLVGATALVAGAGWSQTAAARVRHRLVPRPAHRGAAVRLPPPPPWLAGALATAGLAWPVAAVWQGWLAGGVLVAVLAVMVGGPALGAVAAAAVLGAPPLALRLAAGRGDRALEAALAPLLERVARGLRSGATLAQALEESAEETPVLRDELRVVLREVANGDALVVALDRLAVRRPLPAVKLAVAALALGAETGGAQAQALDGLAATLRDRQAVAAEVRALSSQARLSALVITMAPLGFALFAAATDPRSSRFLLRTPIGIACLTVGLALDAVAAWWMARITRSVST